MRRATRSDRVHRRRVRIAFVLASVLVAAGLLFVFVEAKRADHGASFGGLDLPFGLGRKPLTREVLINLCDADMLLYYSSHQPGDGFVFTPQPECGNGSDAPTTASGAPIDAVRPQVTSVRLQGDLTTASTRQGRQFPSQQIVVAAANEGRTSLRVTVTADPLNSQEVLAGNYLGYIEVEREQGQLIEVFLSADVANRGSWVAAAATIALLLGALVGSLIKWTNDTFTPVAGLRRQLLRLRRWQQDHEANLPEGVTRRWEDVRAAVDSFDMYGVADTIGLFTSHQDALAQFAYTLSGLEQEILVQDQLLKLDGVQPLAFSISALEAEREFLADMRNREWPWSPEVEAEMTAQLTVGRDNFHRITRLLRSFAITPDDETKRARLQGLFQCLAEGGSDELADPELPAKAANVVLADAGTTEKAVTLPRVPRPRPEPREHPFRHWALDHAVLITSVAAAGLITFVGYQTQFLNSTDFDGGAGDYARLIGWSLALQISGTTIVQVVGRLSTST